MRFQIVIMQPSGYPHSGAFTEVAETVMFGLRALGHEAQIHFNKFDNSATNIIFGSHLLIPQFVSQLPRDTVIYNLEQVEDALFLQYPLLKEIFAKFEWWDYSLENLQRLRTVAASARMFHLPIGYVPELTRIPRAPRQDIDVLFYGSVNERRGQILAGLKAGGLVLKWLFGVYGAERDAFVARSKVVLNMHNFENKVFEIVRVSYLLANRKAVVSEISDTTAIEPDMMDAVAGVRYDGLVDCCRRLVGDIAARATLEETGFKRMAARNEIGFLQRLFADRAKAR